VREALARLLSSRMFSRSTQLCHFLEYTVGRRLEEPDPRVKEYTIAVQVFGRPASFDPRADGTVRTEARRLRRKLDRYYESEGRGDPIRIEYPKGSYVPRFVASGTSAPSEPSDAAENPDVPQAPAGEQAPHLATSRFGRVAWISVAVVTIALIGLAIHFLPSEQPVASASPRVGVLPFQDVSPEPVNDDFALAMSEAILTRLADVDEMEIVSRTSLTFENSSLSRSQIAAALGANYLIGGTIAKSQDSFHVDAQLIRALDDRELWTGSFDFSWPEVFDAQEQVAQQIAEQLSLSEMPRTRRLTGDLEAYEAYLKGRFSTVRYNHNRRESLFEEAKERLLRAVEVDPNLVEAWAELGVLHVMRLHPPRPGMNREEILGQARVYLERALAIDPTCSDALTWLGLVEAHSGRRLEGIQLIREAIRSDPRNANAHEALGEIYGWLGFHESAIVEYERTVELDPLFLSAFALVAREQALVGRWEEALNHAERFRQLAPESPFGEIAIGDVYYRMGDFDRAEATWREGDAKFPSEESGIYDIVLALSAAGRGDLEPGRRVLEINRDVPDREYTHLTEVAALLDEREFALERVIENPQRSYRWLISNQNLARLASDPQFANLVRSLHTEWQWHLEALGDTLPVPPPELPDPEEFLAQVN
jgi:TolB-like protein